MKKDPIVDVLDETTVKRTAKIMGPNSASAQALKAAEKYRAEGKEVEFCRTKRGTLLVVPLWAR